MLCAAEVARKDERRVQMGRSPRVYPGGALDRAAAGALLKSLKNVLGKNCADVVLDVVGATTPRPACGHRL
jgi:hypothetical protein